MRVYVSEGMKELADVCVYVSMYRVSLFSIFH